MRRTPAHRAITGDRVATRCGVLGSRGRQACGVRVRWDGTTRLCVAVSFLRPGRNNQQSPTNRQSAVALQPQSRHLFRNIIHRDFLTGFNHANGNVAAGAATRVRIAWVIDEPRWRLEQDVLTVDYRNKDPFFCRKPFDCLIAQHFTTSTPIKDDFTYFDASRRKNSSPVDRRVLDDDPFHVRALYRLSTFRATKSFGLRHLASNASTSRNCRRTRSNRCAWLDSNALPSVAKGPTGGWTRFEVPRHALPEVHGRKPHRSQCLISVENLRLSNLCRGGPESLVYGPRRPTDRLAGIDSWWQWV